MEGGKGVLELGRKDGEKMRHRREKRECVGGRIGK